MKQQILLLTTLILLQLTAFAGPSDLIKKAGTAEDYPHADYLVVLDETIVDMKESGLSYNDIHKVLKVLTPQGAKHLNHLSFNYDPLSAFIEIKEVKIYRKNGVVEILGKERIYDYPAPARAIYWGARQKMVDIGRLEPGDGIEVTMFKKGFTYALLYDETQPDDSKYIPPMRGQFYDIVEFWNNQPVLKKIYEVTIPNTKELHYTFFHGDVKTYIHDQGEKTLYRFTKGDMMPLKREPGMVALSNVAPKLLLTTTADWEDKSIWFYNVNEDFGSFESTPEIDKKVDEILKDAQTEMDSISLLNHWVADNIRYSGISMGEGEGYTLHTGDMTFTDRCGVCKDKAGMLITMLRAAGFESYAAMTMARSNIEDIPADQFNHSITVVKLSNGQYKLLDPTWVPFTRELWSSLEQQQDYLLGVPEGADLKETPVSPPKNHYFRMNGDSKLLKDGTLEGELEIEAEGQSDGAIRSMFTRSYKTEWDKNLEMALREIAPDLEILEMNYSKPYNYQEENMKITLKYRIPDFATVTENEIIFTPVVARELFKSANSHLYFNPDRKERKYDFRDRCSRLVELSETIKLPEFEKAVYVPKADKIEGSAASFNGGYEVKDNQLILNEKIVFEKRKYKKEEWDNFRNVVAAQKKLANEKIILKK